MIGRFIGRALMALSGISSQDKAECDKELKTIESLQPYTDNPNNKSPKEININEGREILFSRENNYKKLPSSTYEDLRPSTITLKKCKKILDLSESEFNHTVFKLLLKALPKKIRILNTSSCNISSDTIAEIAEELPSETTNWQCCENDIKEDAWVKIARKLERHKNILEFKFSPNEKIENSPSQADVLSTCETNKASAINYLVKLGNKTPLFEEEKIGIGQRIPAMAKVLKEEYYKSSDFIRPNENIFHNIKLSVEDQIAVKAYEAGAQLPEIYNSAIETYKAEKAKAHLEELHTGKDTPFSTKKAKEIREHFNHIIDAAEKAAKQNPNATDGSISCYTRRIAVTAQNRGISLGREHKLKLGIKTDYTHPISHFKF